jgi:nitrate reductase NapE component
MSENRELLEALDPDQRQSALRTPVPRRQLGARILFLLWTLRIYVVLAVGVVVYAFVKSLLR